MVVYVVYDCDYEYWKIHKIYTTEKEAIIYASEHGYFVEPHELSEGEFDVDKYNIYEYYEIFYNPKQRDPIYHIQKKKSSKYPEENPISLAEVTWEHKPVFNVMADSDEEAKEIFYNAFKEVMDKYYAANNILRQNGKIKTWKKP